MLAMLAGNVIFEDVRWELGQRHAFCKAGTSISHVQHYLGVQATIFKRYLRSLLLGKRVDGMTTTIKISDTNGD